MNISMRFLFGFAFMILFIMASIAFPFCMYKLTPMNRYQNFIKAMKENRWVIMVSLVFVIAAFSCLIYIIPIGKELSNSVINLSI